MKRIGFLKEDFCEVLTPSIRKKKLRRLARQIKQPAADAFKHQAKLSRNIFFQQIDPKILF